MVMRRLLRIVIIFFLGFMLLQACSSHSGDNSKPKLGELLKREQIRAVTVPNFLIRYLMLFNAETRKIQPLLKGVTSATFALSNSNNASEIFERIENSLNLFGYEDLLEVIGSKSKITIKQLKQGSIIKELVLLINDTESILCLSMRGKITNEELLEVVAKFANQSGIENPV